MDKWSLKDDQDDPTHLRYVQHQEQKCRVGYIDHGWLCLVVNVDGLWMALIPFRLYHTQHCLAYSPR